MDKTLEQLAIDLYDTKVAEAEATARRVEIEEQIAALVPTGDVGSKTVKAGALKLTVKRAMKYVADVDAIRDIGESEMPGGAALPLAYVPPQEATYKFDEKAYERMREIYPEAFLRISQLVTATPRKIAVELKLA
jgi:hypothetical protein